VVVNKGLRILWKDRALLKQFDLEGGFGVLAEELKKMQHYMGCE
jgi:hypothetical protein